MSKSPAGKDDDVFLGLVRTLAHDLEVRVAFVCELIDDISARTLALSVDDEFLENLEYKVAGTPCARVHQEGHVYHPSKITSIYPEDNLLKEWSVDSYMGVAVFGSRGKLLGHIGVMGDRQLDDEERSLSLLNKLARRAGLEMERRRALVHGSGAPDA